ncbi:MAG: T9SS type A sorting domain-containing protein [Bacteroidetes bacterium]|nr:T9SS type A sorting domain-containing protein [Bacteroidota bacterium]
MKKLIYIFVTFCYSFVYCQDQDTIFDINSFDKENIVSFKTIKDSVFGKLDTNIMETKILFSVVDGPSKTKYFKGGINDIAASYEDFYIAYNQINLAHLGNSPLKKWFLQDSISIIKYASDRTIPLSVLFFKYDILKEDAIQSNLIFVENNYSLADNPNRTSSPYETSTLFISRPHLEYINGLKFKFLCDPGFIFTNYDLDDLAIQVDYDDGLGYRTMNMNQTDDVQYSSYGTKIIKTKITIGEENYYSYSTFKLVSDNTKSLLDDHITDYMPDFVNGISSNGEYGTVVGSYGIWYGCGNNKSLRKPVIISSGFDPFNSKTLIYSIRGAPLYDTYNGVDHSNNNNGNNLLEKLRGEGYDIIILDYLNGVDYIERNAQLLTKLIKLINTQLATSGSKHECIVMGFSAGALNARFSLTDMEKLHNLNSSNPHHHSWKYVSMDGEHQGANIPYGTQRFIQDLIYFGPPSIFQPIAPLAASLAWPALNNATAFESSIYHIFGSSNTTPASHSLKDNFFNTLYNLNPSSGGYPVNTRNVGVTQGSSNGTQVPGIPVGSQLLHLKTQTLASILGLKFRSLTEYYANGNNALIYTRNSQVRYSWWGSWNTTFVNNIYSYGAEALDNCQGSQTDFHHSIVKPPILFNVPYFVNVNYIPSNESFNASIGAVDVRNGSINLSTVGKHVVPLNYNIASNLLLDQVNTPNITQHFGYPHLNTTFSDPKLYTPFDALYSTVSNEFHIINPPHGIGDFLTYKELAPFNLKLQNRTIGNTEPYKAAFEARKTVNAGEFVTLETPNNKYIVDQYGDVTVTAGEEVGLQDGFEAKLGCKFEAYIKPYLCTTFPGGGWKLASVPPRSVANSNSEISELQKNKNSDNRFFIFPNPSNGIISIKNNSNVKNFCDIKILTADGKTVRTFNEITILNQTEIDLQDLKSGIYFIQILSKEIPYFSKIIITD